MRLFHGSNTPGIRVLEPRQADHDRPYIYLTTIDVVAAFYLCNAVERALWAAFRTMMNPHLPDTAVSLDVEPVVLVTICRPPFP